MEIDEKTRLAMRSVLDRNPLACIGHGCKCTLFVRRAEPETTRCTCGCDAERHQRGAREALAGEMLALGLATGHGDTHEDLLGELRRQVEELQESIRHANEARPSGW